MAVSTTSDLLQEALTLHRRGAVADAASRYAEVLRADPANADAHYYLAMIACQNGRFDEGAAGARKSLASDPRHARAHVLLGRSLGALGQPQEALASFERAIKIAPDLAQAHGNRADLLSELGRYDEAIVSYDRAVALAPDSTEDWFNRGAALAAVGRHDEAVASFDRAIAGKPDFTQAHLSRAGSLAALGRHGEALEAVGRVIAIAPKLAEAWLGRGNVLNALKRYDEALAAFEQALALKPDLAEAWLGRGRTALAAGRPGLAADAASQALALGATAKTKAFFVHCVRSAHVTADDDGRLRGLLLRALTEGWAPPREVAQACVNLIKLDGAVTAAIARANAAWPARVLAAELPGSSTLAALARNELLCCLLEIVPVADVGLERVLANVRFAMLAAGVQAGNEAGNEACDESVLRFYGAVARQCFVNEYVVSATATEAAQAAHVREALEAVLAAGDPCPALLPVIVGAYFPLCSLAKAGALLQRAWPQSVEAVIAQQVKEPAQERLLAAAIPALTAIDGEVSRLVRQQYEENPYPRWVKPGPPESPAALMDRRPDEIRDVLFAGCGTGPFTVAFARQAPQARILAIDLSLASLGYAKRMAEGLGLANIEFAQADITRLASLGRAFDFIDASGVLHHLADPWAGWRVLLALLRPGGTMQVGLYSELGRRNVVAARALIAERGYRSTADDIRRCREEIMAADAAPLLKSVTLWPDFFSMSECRDLLFHVQEHRMTLPQIKSFLASSGVQFAGFQLDAAHLQRFGARFPDRAALTDLDCWQAFETLAPETFAGMYQFSVRKPA